MSHGSSTNQPPRLVPDTFHFSAVDLTPSGQVYGACSSSLLGRAAASRCSRARCANSAGEGGTWARHETTTRAATTERMMTRLSPFSPSPLHFITDGAHTRSYHKRHDCALPRTGSPHNPQNASKKPDTKRCRSSLGSSLDPTLPDAIGPPGSVSTRTPNETKQRRKWQLTRNAQVPARSCSFAHARGPPISNAE